MVALLFRTLDAFRIFDSIFIMTAGANGTESVSFLAYRQTIARVEIGLGSAVSVLLFLAVVLIAFGFIKGFKVDLSQARGETLMSTREKAWWWIGGRGHRALLPVPDRLDRLAVVQGAGGHRQRAVPADRARRGRTTTTILTGTRERPVPAGAAQLVRHLPHRDGISCILAMFAAYAIARLDFPGKRLILSTALGVAIFPVISIVTPLFNLWRQIGLYDTWLGPDHPVPVADAADLDLDACRRSSARSRGRWSRPRRSTAPPPGRRSAR